MDSGAAQVFGGRWGQLVWQLDDAGLIIRIIAGLRTRSRNNGFTSESGRAAVLSRPDRRRAAAERSCTLRA